MTHATKFSPCKVTFLLRTAELVYSATLECFGREPWREAMAQVVLSKPELAGCWGGGEVTFEHGEVVFSVEGGAIAQVW